jgi:hypothetical protein
MKMMRTEGGSGSGFPILIMIGSWGPGHLLASHRLGLARWHTHASRQKEYPTHSQHNRPTTMDLNDNERTPCEVWTRVMGYLLPPTRIRLQPGQAVRARRAPMLPGVPFSHPLAYQSWSAGQKSCHVSSP